MTKVSLGDQPTNEKTLTILILQEAESNQLEEKTLHEGIKKQTMRQDFESRNL